MQLTIEKLVYGGDGLARLPADERGPGKAVFVPFVLPGERIETSLTEQKPGFDRARADNIVEPSAHRIEPHCPYFVRCGGCHYQHASYEHQLEIKAAILKENLRRIAKLELQTDLTIHPSPPWNYRNRARLKVQTAPEFALGYRKFNSHELLAVESCPISSPLINRAIAAVWQLGREGKVPDGIQEIEFFVNAEDTELLIEVYCGREIPAVLADQCAAQLRGLLPEAAGVTVFGTNSSHGDGHSDPEKVAAAGTGELTYNTQRASYRVGAGAFFQINRHLTNELVNIVTANASGETAFDLYAGVGLFSTVLSARFAQVIAVEASPTSYADLLHNSPANVKAVRATTDQFLKSAAGKFRPVSGCGGPAAEWAGGGRGAQVDGIDAASDHLCFLRSGDRLAGSGWPDQRWISHRAGASRGFVSPDLPSGERVPPCAIAPPGKLLARDVNLNPQSKPPVAIRPRSGGRQPLLWAAFAHACGILAGFYLWRPTLWWLVAAIAFSASGTYWLRSRARPAFALGLSAILVAGALSIQLRPPRPRGSLDVLPWADGREVLITAHVNKEGNVQEQGSRGVQQRLDVETEQITADSQSWQVRSGLRVSFYGKETKNESEEAPADPAMHLFRYGERVRFPAKLYPPRNFRNPGAFDYRGYLAEHGIAALASTRVENVELLPGFAGNRFVLWRTCIHRSILGKIHALWPERDAALVDALLIGENSFLGRDVLTEFQRTGTYHVLVISGLKVGILALVLFWLLRRLRVGESCCQCTYSAGHRGLCAADRRWCSGLASNAHAHPVLGSKAVLPAKISGEHDWSGSDSFAGA